MTLVHQAGGLVLAAAVAAGSYSVKVDRAAGTRERAADTVIQPAPERPVRLSALRADRSKQRSGRPKTSSTTRRAAMPPPADRAVVACTRPVASSPFTAGPR